MPSIIDYCSQKPITVKRDYGLLDAAASMRDNHVGCLIVVDDGPDGTRRPIGILTDRDIVVRVIAQTDRQLHLVRVDDIMTPNPLLVQDTDDLSDTLMTMRARGVRRVPVVSATGSLVGLLSFDDILDLIQDEVSDLAHLVGRERRRERRVTG